MMRFGSVEVPFEGLPPHTAAWIGWVSFRGELDWSGLQNDLGPEERTQLEQYTASRRRQDFLLGRKAAKIALSAWAGSPAPLASAVVSGVFGQPNVLRGPEGCQVSISHTDNLAVALAFPESHPMGLDVERRSSGSWKLLKEYFTEREQTQIRGSGLSADTGATVLWAAKESLGKTLRTGLTIPLTLLETEAWRGSGPVSLEYAQFSQYRASVLVEERVILSLCYPRQLHAQPFSLGWDELGHCFEVQTTLT